MSTLNAIAAGISAVLRLLGEIQARVVFLLVYLLFAPVALLFRLLVRSTPFSRRPSASGESAWRPVRTFTRTLDDARRQGS